VKRNLKSSAAPAYAPAPVMAAPAPVVMSSPAPSAPSTIEEDDEEDESKLFVSAPKVGIFRRGRYAAGKRVGKGLCANTGDQVKKGQVLGFIEQLGTFIAVEAPQAGECRTREKGSWRTGVACAADVRLRRCWCACFRAYAEHMPVAPTSWQWCWLPENCAAPCPAQPTACSPEPLSSCPNLGKR
jgi:biotin carboxyl carrier protein